MATAKTNQDSKTMRVTLFTIRNRFPKVKQLETEVLDNWLKGDKIDNLILLDVREIEEYKVSHLLGAVWIKPNEPIDQVIMVIKNRLNEMQINGCVKIVAYCSLGYRSSSMVQKIDYELRRMKATEDFNIVTEVYNLEGSIFKWANEGRTMVDCNKQETQYCHPYSIVWGRLLTDSLRKYEPVVHTNMNHLLLVEEAHVDA